jgi:hypothetical protein
MRKLQIIGAATLFLAGSLAWAVATPLPIAESHYTLLKRIGCTDADSICPQGQVLACANPTSTSPNCRCDSCAASVTQLPSDTFRPVRCPCPTPVRPCDCDIGDTHYHCN